MSATAPARPGSDEYAPYYEKYVSRVPEGGIVETLRRQSADTLALLRSLTEEQAASRYAEGKWSVKELVGHICDGERVFAYRALRFARGDETPLPGFEQDDYVRNGGFDKRSLIDLASEYEYVRRSTIALFASLDEEAWERLGTSNNTPASLRAVALI